MTLSGGPPPLYNHAMALSPHPWNPPGRRIAWLYGGHIGSTTTTSSVLWRLELGASDPADISWASASPADPNVSPGGRVGHTLFYDGQSSRLSIVGGSTATSPDRHLYQVALDLIGGADWVRGEEAPVSLSGHAVGLDPNIYKVVARIPEIYNPVANNWTSHSLAARSEDYYPLQFLVPRIPFRADSCRVVVVGPQVAQYLDIPATGQAPAWNTIVNGDPGFGPSAGAMYQPGRILVAGGDKPRQYPYIPEMVDRSATLSAADVTNGVGWQASGPMAFPRFFHNLAESTLPEKPRSCSCNPRTRST